MKHRYQLLTVSIVLVGAWAIYLGLRAEPLPVEPSIDEQLSELLNKSRASKTLVPALQFFSNKRRVSRRQRNQGIR